MSLSFTNMSFEGAHGTHGTRHGHGSHPRDGAAPGPSPTLVVEMAADGRSRTPRALGRLGNSGSYTALLAAAAADHRPGSSAGGGAGSSAGGGSGHTPLRGGAADASFGRGGVLDDMILIGVDDME